MSKDKTKGAMLILLSALMFGSYATWARLIGDEFDLWFQGWTRALFISIVLLPVLYFRKEITGFKKKDVIWLIVFLTFTSMTQGPIFYAANHMDVAASTVIFFVSMLLTMYAVGYFFLREKITAVKVASFTIAVLGLVFASSVTLTTSSVLAVSMAIVAGMASGGEVAFSKKLSDGYSPLYLCWLSWIIVFVSNLALSLLLHEHQAALSFSMAWIYQLSFAVAGIIGFWSVITGLKYVQASIGGLIGLLEIIFSMILGWLIFDQVLSGKMLIGAMLILIAAALPHIAGMKRKRARLHV